MDYLDKVAYLKVIYHGFKLANYSSALSSNLPSVYALVFVYTLLFRVLVPTLRRLRSELTQRTGSRILARNICVAAWLPNPVLPIEVLTQNLGILIQNMS